MNKDNIQPYVAYMVGSLVLDHQDISHQLCRGQNWQVHSCPAWKGKVQVMRVKRTSGIGVPLLNFLLLDTHDPKAIKLHRFLIEFFDFLVPPLCCFWPEEVWECGIWPVELEVRSLKFRHILNISEVVRWMDIIVPVLGYPSPDSHLL